MGSKVWSANNPSPRSGSSPLMTLCHGSLKFLTSPSQETFSPMWQAHGGRDRCAVWLGLADQTCCPTTQGRWGRDRSLRLRCMQTASLSKLSAGLRITQSAGLSITQSAGLWITEQLAYRSLSSRLWITERLASRSLSSWLLDH